MFNMNKNWNNKRPALCSSHWGRGSVPSVCAPSCFLLNYNAAMVSNWQSHSDNFICISTCCTMIVLLLQCIIQSRITDPFFLKSCRSDCVDWLTDLWNNCHAIYGKLSNLSKSFKLKYKSHTVIKHIQLNFMKNIDCKIVTADEPGRMNRKPRPHSPP